MWKITEHTSTKTMATAAIIRGLAPPAAAIHGCWTMKAMRPAPEMVIGNIAVLAVRAKRKRSMPAVTATVTEVGRNTPPVSTGAKVLAGIAVIQTMNTLPTA